MALPTAHAAVAVGLTRKRSIRVLLFLAFLSVLPDFDFLAVLLRWQNPQFDLHRSWSHSLFFSATLTLLWYWIRPQIRILKEVSPGLFFSALVSHAILDMLCTSNAADHGVAILWPFLDTRYGWPVLVPLYLKFASSPFSITGALKFTSLELLLAGPLFLFAGMMRASFYHIINRFKTLSTAEREAPELEL